MNKWEIESKITVGFGDVLTQGQQEVIDYVEQLQQKVNQLETNRDEVIKELKKFKNNAWSLTFYTKIEEFIEILERGKE